MARVRVALIGLGMAVMPHAKSLLDLRQRVDVAYAFAPSASRRRDFQAQYPFPLCDRLETILDDPTVAAVFILTPPNTHLDLVRRAAQSGKHVLLEKPLEVSTARSRALVETCRAAGVRLAVMLQHRFRPGGIELRRMLARGELGEIVGVSTSIRLWRPQSYYDQPGRGTRARDGGGVLLTQGIHTLDLMLSLAGPIVEVTGYSTTTSIHRMETEDMVAAAARFANGALGVIDATTSAFPGFPERIELACKNATAVIAGTALDVRFHDGRVAGREADGSGGGTGADPMAFPHDYHRALIGDFLDAVANGREPAVSGVEALKVHHLIDALLETSRTSRPVAVSGG
ncbi:MAG TPA: Gfo/Idh/MocA family oxidoreductase [Alphaproteobacteria bacterium]|nr:Gfo/Idh/MocA family oxidoreductase [Alphaproteobacteria bacterium]